ncbi:MAG: hypothetical protein ACKVT0_16900 [Planctomycetaceae bacterium]
MMPQRTLIVAFAALVALSHSLSANEPLRVGTFDVDASPPIGSMMAYDPVKGIQTPLTCRGIVILGTEQPIVLCAVDWIEIANAGHSVFREKLADAAGTDPHHVAVHALHQHDAPWCDFSAEELLVEHGLSGAGFDPNFAHDVIRRTAAAIKEAIAHAKPVTHLGIGKGIIEKVASNRRILGPEGKVIHVRWTATTDPKVRDFPVGTIDPEVKLIAFYDGADNQPIVVLTYYATHPQSYYHTGLANPDFPGLARNARQEETGVMHVHFDGAGGNIGAGKWNDGSPENRQVLADRVAAGMKQAWENIRKVPISADDVAWNFEPVSLPVSKHMDESALANRVENKDGTLGDRFIAAVKLTWMKRCQMGDTIDIGCLTLGDVRILHMPGELFVEYQLAAQQLRPDLFVAMAAYGDCGPGYIGTEVAYGEGGYETSPGASNVAPAVESVLMNAVKKLLGEKEE